ncbi:aminotransferase class V-fold PLP-dependent enzyme [Agromyces archimandritae]|uniref:Aminotransferase class V-fold PLP-dependent enzyme n=1 Tax=Agromyces archimandritae TaxID=2781962 RepID=A0A975FMF1_9MICO|nr:aminotransferase class V-fold PLP-dependent enzyme [Agromyces archimandritae]QTX03676.1 aminotransferase class V-fold PLP-dependent enzyme [Agromyces archimandritae]
MGSIGIASGQGLGAEERRWMPASPGGPARSAPPGGAPAGRPAVPITPLAVLADSGLEVPVLGGGAAQHTNLDLAASAPALAGVARHVASVLPWYSSVHRGSGFASETATALVEGARASIGERLGARPDDLVVFTRNTTDALALLAGAVPGETVVLDIEHHANLLPWERYGRRVVRAAPTIAETLAAVDAELARRPAALVSVTGASNVTGELLPLERFAAVAHAHGARLAVDAAQLVPHRAVDLAAAGIDYLAASGHKAYAPYGAGVLVGRADWLDAALPYLAGGGAVERVDLDRTRWKTGPERHEAGTPNVLGITAFARALDELAALGDARLAHEEALTARLRDGLAALPGVRLLRGFDDAEDAVGIAAVELERGRVGLIAGALAAEHGVSVRAGRFCAHPFFDRIAARSNGLRASIGVGTSSADVDRFLTALGGLLADGPRHAYERGPDGWRPAHDDRPRPDFAA